MYDRTDQVLEIDRHSVMAIAGVPATAYEMVRILEHSFKYYRRTQLQELSFEGKLRAVSKLLKENVAAALAGTGAVQKGASGPGRSSRPATMLAFSSIAPLLGGRPLALPATSEIPLPDKFMATSSVLTSSRPLG